MHEQDREHGSLLRRPEVRGDSIGDGFERTENSELHRLPSLDGAIVRASPGLVNPIGSVTQAALPSLYAGSACSVKSATGFATRVLARITSRRGI
jgi:hypothetical protein